MYVCHKIIRRPEISGPVTHIMPEMPLAEFTTFVRVLMSDCTISRCDDGLYIVCQAGGQDPQSQNWFAVGQGEVAAHIRAMTDDEPPDASENEDTTSEADGSTDTTDSSDGEPAHVVVNVGRVHKKRRRQ